MDRRDKVFALVNEVDSHLPFVHCTPIWRFAHALSAAQT